MNILNNVDGTEEEFGHLNAQLTIAVESISIHMANMSRIEFLYNDVKKNGISRATMEAIYNLYPDNIPETSKPFLFTYESSVINIEYAYEGFFSAIGDAIKWIFKQIILALTTIVELIQSFIRWILGVEKSNKRSLNLSDKEIEELIKNRDKIVEESEEVIRQVDNGVMVENSDPLIESIKDKAKLFTEKFNTKLDYDIITSQVGFSPDNLAYTCIAILDSIDEIIDNFSISFTRFSKMIKDKQYGLEVTESIGDIRRSFFKELNSQMGIYPYVIPYSFFSVGNLIQSYNGVLCKTFVELANKDRMNQFEWYNPDKTEQALDQFWIGSVKKAGHYNDNHDYSLQWDDSDNAIYSKNLLYPNNYTVSMVNIHAFNMFDIPLGGIESRGKKISSEIKTLENTINEFINKKEHWQSEWIKNLNKQEHGFILVWPKTFNGVNAGESIFNKGHYRDCGYSNINIVEQIFKGDNFRNLWMTYLKAVIFLNGGFKDVLKTLKRAEDINLLLLQDTVEREKINKLNKT